MFPDPSSHPLPWLDKTDLAPRENAAVAPPKAGKCFVFIVQALEAETLQGATATRLVAPAKHLLATAGMNPMDQLSPETQQVARAFLQG